MRTPWTPAVVVAIVSSLAAAVPANAGRIVVNHDEWALSNTGFVAADEINDPGIFINNVVSWFSGSGPAVVRAWSTNEIMIDTKLASALAAGGHTYTSGINGRFTLENLQTFDVVILAGNQPSSNVGNYSQTLIDYVEGGGNVYLAGGTGVGGAQDEAARWNTFLNHFGLRFAASYNGIRSSARPINSNHPIFENVDHLYDANGNSVFQLDPADLNTEILVNLGEAGLYAIYDPHDNPGPGPGPGPGPNPMPVPATFLLVVLGAGVLGLSRGGRVR